MVGMSPWHGLIVVAVAILLFGARRLPDAARSLGRSARIPTAELRGVPEPGTRSDPDPTPRGPGSETVSGRSDGHPRRADEPTGTRPNHRIRLWRNTTAHGCRIDHTSRP